MAVLADMADFWPKKFWKKIFLTLNGRKGKDKGGTPLFYWGFNWLRNLEKILEKKCEATWGPPYTGVILGAYYCGANRDP